MIDLPKAKLHCRIDHDEEDTLVQGYIDAADVQIQANLDRKVIATEAERVDENDLVDNKALDAARLLFIGHLYANREATTQATIELPLGYWALIQPYRNMGV